MIEDEIRRATKLLATLVQIAGLSRQDLDRLLGQGRGYASQVLTGRVELKYRHILAILEVVDVEPGIFFRVLYPEPDEPRQGAGGRVMERLLERLHQAGYQDRPSPAASTPAPIDTAELERRIKAVIREVFGEREIPPGPPEQPPEK
jgi:transcriptional regulator with XRE-family HTH domain